MDALHIIHMIPVAGKRKEATLMDSPVLQNQSIRFSRAKKANFSYHTEVPLRSEGYPRRT
jgi:hypothetical protein